MKTSSAAFVFAVLSLFFCSVGEAANWTLVGTSEDGNVSLYIDIDSVGKNPENITSAAVKFLFGNPESFESKEFFQMSVRVEYNCVENKTRMIELTFNYADGGRESFKPEGQWRSVKPGTLEAESSRYLCKQH